jgi:hypothetical protein
VWTCTCPAGNPPCDERGYPKYGPRLCWYIRTAVHLAREMAEERRARHEAEARLYDDKDAHTLSDQDEQRFLKGRLAEITALN